MANAGHAESLRMLTIQLEKLVGLPLVWIDTVGAAGLIKIGKPTAKTVREGPRKGTIVQRSPYGIHCSCSWRISRRNEIVVGHEDSAGKVSEEPGEVEPQYREWRLLDWRIQRLFAAYPKGLVIRGVQVSAIHDLYIELADDHVLAILPMCSSMGDYEEQWRLLTPSDVHHTVVSTTGISFSPDEPDK